MPDHPKHDQTDYGFTDNMIVELLPQPMLAPNPHYRRAAPMRLWFDDEVAGIAGRPEVAARLEEARSRRAVRSAAAAKGVAKRREATRLQVDEAIRRIRVKVIGLKELRRRAISAKEDWYAETDRWEESSEARFAPDEVIRRWMVNYVRHHLTDYEKTLYDMAGQVGCREEYERYRSAVMAAIADAYPSLSGAVLAAESWRNMNDGIPVDDNPYGYRARLDEERKARTEVSK